MEKSRMAFDSDENTESNGEEVKSEVEGPTPGDPKGNPHEYIDDEPQEDGVPLDKDNSEHLSNYKGISYEVKKAMVGFKVVFNGDRDPIGPFDSEREAHEAAKKEIEESGSQMSKGEGEDQVDKESGASKGGAHLHEDAKRQEPGKDSGLLASVIEHEGHSAGVHFSEEGYQVRGKGSASYIRSEPIAKREHAEEYAREVLKAHAKLSEREIVSKMTNLSETAGNQWESVSPKEKKSHWASLTGSNKHKITACMNSVEGHVDNPGAYCKSLADEVGYKPE